MISFGFWALGQVFSVMMESDLPSTSSMIVTIIAIIILAVSSIISILNTAIMA